jgi:hypothetical protein
MVEHYRREAIMADIFRFLSYIWNGIGEAMRLNPRMFEAVQAYPQSGWVILVIALLGGASLLVGQSVILFVNQVRPGRFALSLLLNGIVFTISLGGWAVATWLAGQVLLPNPIPLGAVIRMIGLGAAPYVFAFLMLIPYAGNFIGRLLAVWSFLVVLAGITHLAEGAFWLALICVGVGWLLVMVMSATIGRPVIALRNYLWQRVTGSTLDVSVQDILTTFASEPQPPPSQKERDQ